MRWYFGERGDIWNTIGSPTQGTMLSSRRAKLIRSWCLLPEIITLFHVSGGYVYVDPQSVPLGYEDVFTKLASASRHYEALGSGESFVEQFVR
ncbi:hypothetical protein NXT3_PB00292 (plasmid) [Sinorhizobium fredii]|uniref:Uncharacterized protein n=1 Tax=Rhizobium fredii TaxID=380 RepID=A0A2L0HDX1_RHIFR|nr:hypothetical protein NXT3_PB00292 [Sinorhizobium fredii]